MIRMYAIWFLLCLSHASCFWILTEPKFSKRKTTLFFPVVPVSAFVLRKGHDKGNTALPVLSSSFFAKVSVSVISASLIDSAFICFISIIVFLFLSVTITYISVTLTLTKCILHFCLCFLNPVQSISQRCIGACRVLCEKYPSNRFIYSRSVSLYPNFEAGCACCGGEAAQNMVFYLLCLIVVFVYFRNLCDFFPLGLRESGQIYSVFRGSCFSVCFGCLGDFRND